MNYDAIGFIAAFFTTFSFVPQVWRTIKTNDTKGISLLYFGFFLIGISIWLTYGILKCDLAIICANFVTIIFTAVILFYKIRNIIRNGEGL